MEYFLQKIAENENISNWIRTILKRVSSEFNQLGNYPCNNIDEKSWGKLFLITIFIRLLGEEFHDRLMPFARRGYEVSLNSTNGCFDLKNCATVADIIAQLHLTCTSYPHIAVIEPPFIQSEKYDLLIAVLDDPQWKPRIYAYKCNMGKKLVSKEPIDEMVTAALWINAPAPAKLKKKTQWIVANASEIESFFGVSGKYWAPTLWPELNAKKKIVV